MNSTKQLYRLRAIQLFIFSFILTTIAFLFIGVMFWGHYESSKAITLQATEVESIEGDILLYDEMLTMSARMYTSTANTMWEERYNQTVPLLDSALLHAEKVAPTAFKTAIKKTDDANKALIEKETKAFELVKEGNTELAYSTISDVSYQNYKKTYAEGMHQMTQSMKEEVLKLQQENEKRATLASTITLFILPFLLFVWYNTLRLIQKYITQQNVLQLEITNQNKNLEQKVLERTTEIQEKNEELQASEEELRQNLEELQTTQELLQQQKEEIEDKQKLLKKAEVIAKIGSYEWDFVNDTITHSENLPTVYGLPEGSKFTPEVYRTIINPEDYQRVTTEFREQIVAEKETNSVVRYRVKPRQDADWRYVLGEGAITYNEEGQPIKMIGTVQDIHEQTIREQELQNAYTLVQSSEEELKQNLEQLQATQELLQQQKEEIEISYQTLQSAQNQLIQAEKMASLGQLIANIAHEINTPLGAIRSSSDSVEVILTKMLSNFSSFIKKLDDQTLARFDKFVELSIQKTDTLSNKERRKAKYALIEELEQLDVENDEFYADVIMDMNMQDEKELFMSLIQSHHTEETKKEIFDTAYKFSVIIKSNQTIKEATKRAAKTVFALKNYARQDHSEEKIEVNLHQTLETTLTLYYNQTKIGIDVRREFDENVMFLGYPDELMQVWTNLIHNAIQAMKGKGKLIVSSENKENTVLVSIQDTGGGIPKKIQDKIFDAFFTTKVAGEGSGLGLDITRKIIDKHDGKIWFETEEGVGTIFFVELPLLKS